MSLNNDQIDQLGDQGIILGPCTEKLPTKMKKIPKMYGKITKLTSWLGDQGIILGPSTENGDQAVRQQLGRCKQQ